jgi:RimJ/RimL family protein N-acetyltransferase
LHTGGRHPSLEDLGDCVDGVECVDLSDLELLALEAATIFELSEAERILRRNSPEREVGPRFHLAGCVAGNIVRLRHDVGNKTAGAIKALVAEEPPLALPESAPIHLAEFLGLLSKEAPVESKVLGQLLWTFPERLIFDHSARLVASDPREGEDLLAQLTERGMPDYLAVAGFVDIGEFWPPWCVAFEGDQIASIAFAAGLGPESAETGVYTFPAFRGRGYAAAATAGWASLPALRGRTLFYGTSRTNISSRRVTERLGLRYLGASLTIT